MSEPAAPPAITVFTATYNRARTLPRVYESLLAQTFTDFEWVIVDDGSTDETSSLVADWVEAQALPIRYVAKSNGGKHTAWNVGVREARGGLFLSLDSDDSCTPDALQVFHDVWEGIGAERRGEFSGVCALVMDVESNLIGDEFPSDPFDATSDELRFRHHVSGEKWGCMSTELARRYPFPEIDGMRYVPESIVWGRVAARYKERYVNRTLRIYHADGSARLSAPSWQDPRPFALGAQVALEEQAARWFRHDPGFFMKAAANYSRNSWLTSVGPSAQARSLHGGFARALWLAMLPVGSALALRDRVRMHRARL